MRRLVCVFSLAGCLAGLGCGRGEASSADLLIHHAKVYTVDDARPWAEAVAIRDDRILWVGSDAGATAYRGESTRVIDAAGQLLLPGFIDSHNHIRFGNSPDVLKLHDARSLEEIQRRVREFADARPELEWIESMGWSYSAIPGRRLPTAADLEGLTGDRPAFLLAYDGHTAWLNRPAMEQLGLTRGSTLAELEQVVKDPSTGEPTGVVKSMVSLGRSNEAIARLMEMLPEEPEEQRYRSFEKSLSQAIRYGITTVVDPQVRPDSLALFKRALHEGALRPRLQIALFHPPGTSEEEIERFDEARQQLNDDRLRVSAIKL
ncbi:MAG: amidohydrolase family protein, partial [Acidobacteriota bacterium]